MLWKWVQPFSFNYSVFPAYRYDNLYVEHPLEFDRIVQRSFGDNAWVRSGNMQWKVTPVGKGTGKLVSPPNPDIGRYTKSADNVTFVIEVMFDQPLFVSGRTVHTYTNADELRTANADATINITNQGSIFQHTKNQYLFTGANPNKIDPAPDTIKPYSNLTLRGQAVVSYRKTVFNEQYVEGLASL
jgi:hypothetical protein